MSSIGIDLGTTYSCVAFMKNGMAEVIANHAGNRTTPSCIAYTNEERIIGEGAKKQISKNPENTVYDVKRLMGRPFSDPSVQTDMKQWPFKVVEVGKKTKIKVKLMRREMTFYPEEISAAILEYMRIVAQEYIGEKVTSAVITVPAYFNDAQRRSTKDAAEIAGLHVLGMLNEPTAAALAYGLESKNNDKRNILLFDLGGGTFDVTVLIIEDKIYDVKATGGDAHLGGQDFDHRLYSYFLQEFARIEGADSTVNIKARQRLRVVCEEAKIQLSTALSANVEVINFSDGIDLDINISRAKFEFLCEDLFRSAMEKVEQVLEDAELRKEEINEVILVGGSTRIPRIQEMLEKSFGKDRICKTINPDEAVACGAAVHAAFLSGDISATLKGMKLHDVIPLSLGIETKGGIMTFFLERNTKVPTKKWKNIITTVDNQTFIEYPVYEGERSIAKLNNHLGCFTLNGLPPMPAGEAKTEVCFSIDANGILNISARDLVGDGNEESIKITWDKGRFSKDELKKLIELAKKARLEDEIKRKIVTARNTLEALVNKAERIVRDGIQGTASQRNDLKATCEMIKIWMDENLNAAENELKEKQKEIDSAIGMCRGVGGYGAEE